MFTLPVPELRHRRQKQTELLSIVVSRIS